MDIISIEKRDKMIEAVKGEEFAIDKVDAVLKLANIKVELEPVLLGISNNLFYEEHGGRWYIYDRNITDERTYSGFACVGDRPCSALKEPYARLWCAAPKVVVESAELVKWLNACQWNKGDHLEAALAKVEKALKEAGAKI